MKRVIVLSLILILLASACTQAEETPVIEIVDEATATQVPLTETATQEPTLTPTTAPTETYTPEPTATETATPTFTATPDVRVIVAKAQDLIILPSDMPVDANFVVEAYRGTLSNDSIVYYVTTQLGSEMGEVAKAYVEESNRTTGYGISYLKTNPGYVSPIRIYHEVTMFESAEGAFNDVTQFRPQLMEALGRLPLEGHPELGDTTNVYSAIVTEYGQEFQVYLIEFTYRNTAHELAFWGIENEFGVEEIFSIAEKYLERLESVELVLLEE